MAFPEYIATQVLIACKRHCCLCGKNCKTKIELHHIKQKAKGGEDSFDNCIPLCFDCHAEVGSYNNEHPKGKKYTENELKRIRDEFYEKVKNGLIDFEKISDIDRKKINLLKESMTELIEEIVDIDFAAQPFRLELVDEIVCLLDEWKKRKYMFDDNRLELIRSNILEELYKLSAYLNPLNNFFHITSNEDFLIFNNRPWEKLEELRGASFQIRNNLNTLLNKIYEY